MADPFTTLRTPVVPTRPDPAFEARLRARLEDALTLPEGVDVTVTTLEAPATTATATTPAAARMALTPYLAVADARRAIDWYADVFGARLRGEPIEMPDGRVGHAELDFGGSLVMLADEFPDIGHTAPGPGPARPSPSTWRRPTSTPSSPGRRTRGRRSTARRPTRSTAATPRSSTPSATAGCCRRRPAPNRPAAATATWATCRSWSPTSTWLRPSTERSSGGRTSPPIGPTPAGSRTRCRGSRCTAATTGGHLHLAWQVDDVDAAVETVRDLGGAATDPVEMPYGSRSDCTDDQGMAFTLWQPPAGAATAPRPPDLAYLVLNVVDSSRFRRFFGELLGWTFSPGRVEDGWNIEGTTPTAGFAGGAERPSAVPMYRVDDVEAAVDRVRTAGGTATAVATMPYGLTSDCTDDQGTPFYLGQL